MKIFVRTSAILFLLITGCHSSMSPPKPATQPAPAVPGQQQPFENKSAGIAFMYPAGWKPAGATATQFKFDSTTPKVELTLDVPVLPFHIPNMIPVDSVRNGYVDDFKKKVPDAQATNLPDPTVSDARQHRVKLAGHQNGAAIVNDAALLVHADKVYILSVDCDDKSYPAAKAALDAAVQSVQWVK